MFHWPPPRGTANACLQIVPILRPTDDVNRPFRARITNLGRRTVQYVPGETRQATSAMPRHPWLQDPSTAVRYDAEAAWGSLQRQEDICSAASTLLSLLAGAARFSMTTGKVRG